MKKIFLSLTLASLLGAGVAAPAYACEGGKCKMEHATKDGKSKKGKKGAKAESCHMNTATAEGKKSCCMKKDTAKADAAKETKEQKAQR